MNTRKISYGKFLLTAQVMIENTLSDPEMLRAASEYGYTEAKIREGKALYDAFESLFYRKKAALGKRAGAREDALKAWKSAQAVYNRALKVARIALAGNSKAEEALMLSGTRKTDFSGWLVQAETFYGNLMESAEFSKALASYGWTEKKLKEEYALVEKASRMRSAHRNAAGENRKALEDRDEAFTKLAEWISAYRKIIRIALENTPQRLEKLGIRYSARR